ncbi:hypothetical protein NRIC_27020 [Enterococcus florum]|uniref:Cyclophilin-like domain-containing protein n=1 Tax=Enterococcus florum TaxID=2480627 RepID=A0A4P5PEP7_9ENTE|nr:cyclophilin-like fold protein [Enterococcus florum]GCF94811.1 hypothetical protein NRIC_27020 [Enterococcus florum]
MKPSVSLIFLLILLTGCNSGFSEPAQTSLNSDSSHVRTIPETNQHPFESEENQSMNRLTITIGRQTFYATFAENMTAEAFKERLPMTVSMDELNGNEKYYYLPERYPSNSERVGAINNGDLMLYGSDCLVLFYKSFSTSFSYSRIAKIDDPNGFAEAVGRRGVEVAFALAE